MPLDQTTNVHVDLQPDGGETCHNEVTGSWRTTELYGLRLTFPGRIYKILNWKQPKGLVAKTIELSELESDDQTQVLEAIREGLKRKDLDLRYKAGA